MAQFVTVFNFSLAIGTALLQAGIIAVCILLVFLRDESKSFISWLGDHAILLVLVIASGSVIGSLIYSEVIGYSPCSLCWWERIFMYPQAFIAGVALWKKRSDAGWYLVPLSFAGIFVAGYHSYLQYGGAPLASCGLTGISCVQRYVFAFGYITIPLMAFTSFIAILLVLWIQTRSVYYK